MEIVLWGLGGAVVVIVLILLCVGYGKFSDGKCAEEQAAKQLYVQEHADDIHRCEEKYKETEDALNAEYPVRYPYQCTDELQIYKVDEVPYSGWSGYKMVRSGLQVCRNANSIIFLEALQPMPKFEFFTPTEFTAYEAPDFPKKVKEFSVEKIIYFREVGDVQYTTDISGGKVSGGGVSIGGAIVGGLVAGETGAIIGSRQSVKSEGITSTTIEHDSRQVVLKLTDDEVRFDIEIYDIFMKLIPEKEYTYIMATKNEDGNQQKSTVDKLKDSKELLDAGLITEEEFHTLKNELLSAK